MHPRHVHHLIKISIHALHEESDIGGRRVTLQGGKFQSTLSMRRATRGFGVVYRGQPISIHALHEESDANAVLIDTGNDTISIHALHEESDRMRVACQ